MPTSLSSGADVKEVSTSCMPDRGPCARRHRLHRNGPERSRPLPPRSLKTRRQDAQRKLLEIEPTRRILGGVSWGILITAIVACADQL
jgi:hypothetical protein